MATLVGKVEDFFSNRYDDLENQPPRLSLQELLPTMLPKAREIRPLHWNSEPHQVFLFLKSLTNFLINFRLGIWGFSFITITLKPISDNTLLV